MGTAAAEPSPIHAEFFEREFSSFLVEQCLECHREEKPKSGLKLTSRTNLLKGGTRGPAAVSGKRCTKRVPGSGFSGSVFAAKYYLLALCSKQTWWRHGEGGIRSYPL
jgi:hypothetical protein